MRFGRRFVLLAVAIAALVAWAGSSALDRVMTRWSQNDLAERAEILVWGMHSSLSRAFTTGAHDDMDRSLVDVTRDERILAAAACGPSFDLLARSPEFPDSLTCERLGANVRPGSDSSPQA